MNWLLQFDIGDGMTNPPGQKIDERKLGLLFKDIARFRGIMFDQMHADVGLTHVQAFVLNHLHDKDGQTQKELADRMDVGTVTVSGLVNRMEAGGWVERRTDDKDGRAKRIWLTSKTDSIRKHMFEAIDQVNNVTFADLTNSQIDVFIDLLRGAKTKLPQNLENQPTSLLTDKSTGKYP